MVVKDAQGNNQKLSEFLAERGVARVNSKVLGEDVLFAADDAEIPSDNDLVVYCESELRELVGKTPQQLKSIHDVKKAFEGDIKKERAV
tara:strand:+ start:272 stop:538 length:267 start_codon:yes stop_codon:yes gene_type:complete